MVRSGVATVDAMLKECRVVGAHDFTHASMGGRFATGKFYVTATHSEAFMAAYGGCMDAGLFGTFSLVECHRHIGPVVVDLDLRQPGPDRVYTAGDAEAFATSLLAEVRRLVAAPSLRCFVLEKPAPRTNKGGGFKDGLHLVVPDAVTRPELQVALRQALLPRVAELFGDGRFTTSPEAMYDDAVISRNGWMMYGSKKPDEPAPWLVTRTYVLAEGPSSAVPQAVPVPADMRPSELVTLLSIRTHYDESALTDDGRRAVDRILAEAEAAAEAMDAAEDENARRYGDASVPPPDGQLADLVRMLSVERATDARPWYSVGLALHHATGGGADGMRLWQAFGRKCERKFDAGEHADLWAVMGRPRQSPVARPLRVGALFAWAKEDSPAEYAGWRAGLPRADRPPTPGPAPPQMLHGANKQALASALRAVLPGMEGGAEDLDFELVSEGIRFSAGAAAGIVRKDDFTVEVDGRIVGRLFSSFDLKEDVSFLHRSLPHKARYGCTFTTESDATLRSKSPHEGTCIDLQNAALDTRSLTIITPVRHERVTAAAKVGLFMGALRRSEAIHAEEAYGITNSMFVNCCIINNVGKGHARKGPTDFEVVREQLLDHARGRGLRKADGYIYVPVPGCPCGFTKGEEYGTFISATLGDDPVFTRTPRRYNELLDFLHKYNHLDNLPAFHPDRDLLSFANGVLVLSTAELVPNADLVPGHALFGRAARHHLPCEYTGSTATPMLDSVTDHQFERRVADLLCALLGRMLFQVGQLDKWQVMPYLVGVGGTGKSLILKVFQQVFSPGTVGNLTGKREEVFGMANLAGKELVVGRDMPAKLSSSLSQEHMQLMTAGEDLEVPRKGELAVNVTWRAPTIMASNHTPDYVNTGNNVGRRMVLFRFDRPVLTPRYDLEEALLAELPCIVARILAAYAAARAAADAAGGFWKAVPARVLEWQDRMASATNKLHEFFRMDDVARGCAVTRVEGQITSVHDLEAAFTSATGAKFENDPAVMAAFGFEVSETRQMVCLSCKQLAKARGGLCCRFYGQNNRRAKLVVYNMRIDDLPDQ